MYLTLKDFKNYIKESWGSGDPGSTMSPSDPSSSHNYWSSYKKNYVNKLTQLQSHVMNQFINRDRAKIKHIIPTDITIIRIIKNSNNTVDIHMSFKYEENEMWCVLKNYNTAQERLSCPDLEDDNTSNLQLLKIKLRNTLAKWFSIKPGAYKQLKNEVLWYSVDGSLLKTKENCILTVIKSDIDETIAEDKNKVRLRLVKPNNYYFNYWFDKI